MSVESNWPPGDIARSDASKHHGITLHLDTTAGSLLYRRVRHGEPLAPVAVRPLFLPIVYLATAALTFLPLLISAVASPIPISAVSPNHSLPFLHDANVLFMFLVSFPFLVAFVMNDQIVLDRALRTVQRDRTVTVSKSVGDALREKWGRRFHGVNIASQSAGALAGAMVAYVNYVLYTPPALGFWMADGGRLLLVGYVFLFYLALFYALVTVCVCRSVAIAVFFRDVVEHAELRMLPLHPDKAGGLRSIGELGLRNQYILTVLGVNLVLLFWVALVKLEAPSLTGLVVAATVAYVALGPVVFVAPLVPFRAAMLRTKAILLSEVAQRLRTELQRVRGQLPSGPISREDEELIDRLRKIGAVIDELPVWPFDAATLRKFLAAYVIPLLSSIAFSVVKAAYELAQKYTSH